MRVESVEDTEKDMEGQDLALAFPPGEGYLDLRENPRSIEAIAAARQYLPLRNFLSTVNRADSAFITASAKAKCDSPAAAAPGQAYEFASQTRLIFAEPSFNFDRERYIGLSSSLKQLLERDPGNAAHAVLRISPCNFPDQKRRGFCLEIRLVAQGESARQAELRWGLGLARVLQALLFTARTLKLQIGG
ncbi:MAG TPA: hypothetical protein VNI36_13865 [Candidatus Dormibacteraeota bacterium]|nr:hypothetical protein [Candidatus Dormibacteraeota bacterium]